MWAAMLGFPSSGAHPHDHADGTGYGGSSRETCMGSSATKKAAERAKRDQNKSDKEAANVATQLARAMEDPSRATRRELALRARPKRWQVAGVQSRRADGLHGAHVPLNR